MRFLILAVLFAIAISTAAAFGKANAQPFLASWGRKKRDVSEDFSGDDTNEDSSDSIEEGPQFHRPRTDRKSSDSSIDSSGKDNTNSRSDSKSDSREHTRGPRRTTTPAPGQEPIVIRRFG